MPAKRQHQTGYQTPQTVGHHSTANFYARRLSSLKYVTIGNYHIDTSELQKEKAELLVSYLKHDETFPNHQFSAKERHNR